MNDEEVSNQMESTMQKSLYTIIFLAILSSACSKPATAPDTTTPQRPAPTHPSVGDTSQNALDWAGEYQGMIPCASCKGIQTHIILRADNSFEVKTIYLGENERIYKVTGTAVWDANGRNITLADDTQYLVGENQLIMLDRDGKRITGELAEHYVLKKTAQ